MAEQARVLLPAAVTGPFEVYLNGVRQQAGRDFELQDGALVFERRLAREGKLGFWRWLSLFLGVAGYLPAERHGGRRLPVGRPPGRRERPAYRIVRNSFAELTERPGLVPPPIT
jgi:hypothetical protein